MARGHALNGAVTRASDYDLDRPGPVAGFEAQYTGIITGYVQQIDALTRAKINFARGKGPGQQTAVADFNRGKNRQIEQTKQSLRPYRTLYPDLYAAVTAPPPPAIAVAPAGPAPARTNYTQILLAGAFFAFMAANELHAYLHGEAGLLYDWRDGM